MITLAKNNKSEQIRENLLNMLITGDFKAGDRFYSENRLAKMFQVARMTINKVMAVLEHEGILERIQGKGTFVTGIIDDVREKQGVSETTTLALVTEFWRGTMFDQSYVCGQFIKYVDDQAYDKRYKIKVFNLQYENEFTPELREELKSEIYAGIILVHLPSYDLDQDMGEFLKEVSVPVIYGDKANPFLDSVEYDHEWIGWRGADVLQEFGHKNIAFLGFETDSDWMTLRIQGFTKACQENRRSCNSYQIFKIKNSTFGTEHLQRQEIAELFDKLVGHYSAVMCANDHLAGIVMDIAQENQVNIPQHLSVIGVDDDIRLREANLTTFRISGEELAKVSLDLLQKRMKQCFSCAPSVQLIKPRLINRTTTTVYEEKFST